jgi:hypothetical protein
MAEYDWSKNWASEACHHPPHSHELKVFVDDVEVSHVIRCITGERNAGLTGICVAAELDKSGHVIPDYSTGQIRSRVLYGKVEVKEIT